MNISKIGAIHVQLFDNTRGGPITIQFAVKVINARLTLWRISLRMKKYIFAAYSPDSGEYGEWAYECNSPPIAMIAKWSPDIRRCSLSICGRSSGVANMMILSHCGEYLANVKHLYSRHIRQKWYDCPGELLKRWGLSNGYECFRISYESLRLSYEAYDQSAEFRVNPLRMLRLLTNDLRSLQMPCHK